MEYHLQGLLSSRLSQDADLGLVAYHREFDGYTVGRMQMHAEFSPERSESHLALAGYGNRGKFYGIIVVIGDSTLQREFLCHHLQGGNQAYCHDK